MIVKSRTSKADRPQTRRTLKTFRCCHSEGRRCGLACPARVCRADPRNLLCFCIFFVFSRQVSVPSVLNLYRIRTTDRRDHEDQSIAPCALNVSLCFCIFFVFPRQVSVPSVLNLYRTPNQTLQHRVHRVFTHSTESGPQNLHPLGAWRDVIR